MEGLGFCSEVADYGGLEGRKPEMYVLYMRPRTDLVGPFGDL